MIEKINPKSNNKNRKKVKVPNKKPTGSNIRHINGVSNFSLRRTSDEVNDTIKENIANNLPITKWSDEDIKAFIKNINIVNDEGKNVIFQTEEEALVYGTYLQRLHKEIRFFKVIPCFSQYTGKFFMIEPMTTQYSNTFTTNVDYDSPKDFSLVNPNTMFAIVEILQREKKAEEALIKKNNNKEEEQSESVNEENKTEEVKSEN